METAKTTIESGSLFFLASETTLMHPETSFSVLYLGQYDLMQDLERDVYL